MTGREPMTPTEQSNSEIIDGWYDAAPDPDEQTQAEQSDSSVTLSSVLTPLRDYLEHGSWRCSDHGRYPMSEWADDGDCYCGLVRALVEAGCSLPEALHIAANGEQGSSS